MKGAIISFCIGLALGAGGAMLGSQYLGSHLPAFMQTAKETLEGKVVKKQKDPQRLLLTVSTPNGSTLASFIKQASDVDLLVEQGDRVTLGVRQYEPFITDPIVLHVQKEDHTSNQEKTRQEASPSEESLLLDPSEASKPK